MQLFVDRLTNIDCSYLHPDHGIEGESWLVDIVLAGELDDASMIMDFGLVKKRIKALIDYTVDHCLLVPGKSAALHNWQQQSGQCSCAGRSCGPSWSLPHPRSAMPHRTMRYPANVGSIAAMLPISADASSGDFSCNAQ
jgi:6-pyruvoyl-tetrahydropterin synthase